VSLYAVRLTELRLLIHVSMRDMFQVLRKHA